MTASRLAPTFDDRPATAALAAIDVGTNAVRLEIARPSPDGRFETLHQERDPVRPGEGLAATGEIPHRVLDRLVETLARYAAICRDHGAAVRAVATSAIREAKNRDQVVLRVRRETGLELEVISGAEEARLACLGALWGTAPAARSVCIDVGGGSTEVASAIGDQPMQIWSLALGAVGLAERFDARGTIDAERLTRLRAHAEAAIAHEIPGPVAGWPPTALGCSGSARAVIGFAAGRPGGPATTAQLTLALEALASMGPEGRTARFDPSKADILVAAAVILEALARRLGLETIRAADRGLRHGLIADLQARETALEFSRFSRRCHEPVTALP